MSSPSTLARIEQNHAQFLEFLQLAERHFERNDVLSAAIFCQVAADWAWHHHSGQFYSRRLEALLRHIARHLPARSSEAVKFDLPEEGEVLHVLSAGYAVGGHTRLAWRWIRKDPRVSNVLVLQQRTPPVPSPLSEAAKASGGSLLELPHGSTNLLQKAAVLRRLARRHRYVVLHTHPNDVIPCLALFSEATPVILVNHADHVFWVGSSVSHVVAHIRDSGAELARRRRAVDDAHSFVIPIPLDVEQLPPAKVHGSTKRGLSVASAHKYGRAQGTNYVDVLSEVLKADSSVRIDVVGPMQEGMWARAAATSGGRLRAVGVRTDIEAWYRDADLYFDSFPFASITSLIEAVVRGIPALTLAPPIGADVLGCDDPSLDPTLIRARTPDEFAQRAIDLLALPERRQAIGSALREALVASRSLERWREQLDELYARARVTARLDVREQPSDQVDALDELLLQAQLHTTNASFATIWARGAELLTWKQRAAFAARFAREGRALSPLALLSARQVIALKRVVLKAKQVRSERRT